MFNFSSSVITNFTDSLVFFAGAICGGLWGASMVQIVFSLTGVA